MFGLINCEDVQLLVGIFVRSDIVAAALRTRIAVEVSGGSTCARITLVYSG
jgi:hypothetical protein